MRLKGGVYLACLSLFSAVASCALHSGPFDDVPSFVPHEFDCRLQQFALSFATQYGGIRMQKDSCETFHALRVGMKCNLTCSNHTVQAGLQLRESRTRRSQPSIPRIYVDPSLGRNDNPGTKKEPVRSIARGLEVLRRLGAQQRELVLNTGSYFLSDPLILRPEDSFVRIRSSNDGAVEVTGCKSLSELKWERVRSSDTVQVWSAKVVEKEQIQALRLNGMRVERARTPNGRVEDGPFPPGWIPAAERWLPRREPHTEPISVRSRLNRSGFIRTFSTYTTGIGGVCNGNFVPNVSFWCNSHNPRDGPGGVWAAPRGLVWERQSLGLESALFNGFACWSRSSRLAQAALVNTAI